MFVIIRERSVQFVCHYRKVRRISDINDPSGLWKVRSQQVDYKKELAISFDTVNIHDAITCNCSTLYIIIKLNTD